MVKSSISAAGLRFLTLWAALGVGLSWLPSFASGQAPPRKAPARKAPAKAAATTMQPQYKGIWEPVNYAEDLKLTDVFFVSEEEGWVSGAAGTILHTTDGGQTWTPQLGGDPQSQEETIHSLRFVDARHGWALQGHSGSPNKVLRTTDGETWEQVGTVPRGWEEEDYAFTSPTNGVHMTTGTSIFHTTDGGRKWKEVFVSGNDCRAKLEIQGLVQELTCRLYALHMVSPLVGYATGGFGGYAPSTLAVLKTEDGGASWKLSVVDVGVAIYGAPQTLFFKDEATGFWIKNEKVLATTDGGQTWRGLVGSLGPAIRFADPDVGWAVYIYHGGGTIKLSYTTDGGKRWNSREVRNFPAWVQAFSLPRRDRAYVVGDHGMVYRYRVVPAAEEVAAKAIPAPAMPVVGDELTPDLAEIRESARELQTKLGSSKTGAMGGAEQPAPQGDSAPPSEFIQDCCSSEIADLETDVGSFVQDVPVATGKYRTLNLIMAGLRMASDLIGQASAMRDSFRALKGAPNREAALLALQNLLANVDSTGVTVARGFDNPPPLPDVLPQGARAPQTATPEHNAPTTATQTGRPAQAPDKPTQANAAVGEQPSAEQQQAPPSLKTDAEKLKEKMKKKIKVPKIPF